MRMKIIYPKWPKLRNQPEFHLPPHGPVCFAAAVPEDVEVSFCDENVDELDFSSDVELVAISSMLTCQMPRAWAIADRFRSMGVPVILGGIAAMLHAEESMAHVDSVFIGEAEGYFDGVLVDFREGRLQRVYDYLNRPPDIALVGTARRSILNRERYNYRGVQMVDLVHASRGCRLNCFPCCVAFLGGRKFRPRPFNAVVEELAGLDNNHVFFVDNSFAQDTEWNKELFRVIAPLKKRWVSHPIRDDDELLDLAVKAGCWYVYQAVFDTSDFIRRRIRRYKDRGIGVEATVMLGTDDHDEDYIKRLVDFLLEVEVDLAEFTVLTPFPHSPIRTTLEKQGRILHNDWVLYTGAEVVFQPKRMSVDSLAGMYQYSWDTFYGAASKEVMTGRLYMKLIRREVAENTYQSIKLASRRGWRKPGEQGAG